MDLDMDMSKSELPAYTYEMYVESTMPSAREVTRPARITTPYDYENYRETQTVSIPERIAEEDTNSTMETGGVASTNNEQRQSRKTLLIKLTIAIVLILIAIISTSITLNNVREEHITQTMRQSKKESVNVYKPFIEECSCYSRNEKWYQLCPSGTYDYQVEGLITGPCTKYHSGNGESPDILYGGYSEFIEWKDSRMEDELRRNTTWIGLGTMGDILVLIFSISCLCLIIIFIFIMRQIYKKY